MKRFSINCNDSYQVINLIFMGIIILVFIYSAIFSPERNNYPIKSSYDSITDKTSISTGLSHGFSAIIRGRFQEAVNFNPHSIRLFSFFVMQFFMRIVILSYIKRIKKDERLGVVTVDGIISSTLFLLYFYPFLEDLFKF